MCVCERCVTLSLQTPPKAVNNPVLDFMHGNKSKNTKRVTEFELSQPPTSMAALPDNSVVVVCASDTGPGSVKLIKSWAPESFKLEFNTAGVRTVAFDSGTRELLFGSKDYIHVCNRQGGYRHGHSVAKENEKITQIAVDGARGLVYVVKKQEDAAGRTLIDVFARLGKFLYTIGRPRALEGDKMTWGEGTKLAVAPDGKLVVADPAARRVVVSSFSPLL